MQARLIVYVAGVALSIAPPVGTMANQSDKFVGVHEVPRFVCDRVELVPGRAADCSGGDIRPSSSERAARDGVPVLNGHNSICARRASD